MQTLKTAAIVVLLMTVMYGAYVSLTTPPESLPPEVKELVLDNSGFDLDSGLPDSLGSLDINQGTLMPSSENGFGSSPAVDSATFGASFQDGIDESVDSQGHSFAISDGVTAQVADSGVRSDLTVRQPSPDRSSPSATTAEASLAAASLPAASSPSGSGGASDAAYPSTSLAFDMPDPNSNGFQAANSDSDSLEPNKFSTDVVSAVSSRSDRQSDNHVSQANAVSGADSELSQSATSAPKANVGLANAIRIADQQFANDQRQEALATLSLFYNTPGLSETERGQLLARLDPLAAQVVYSQRHLLEPPHRVGHRETLMQIAVRYEVPWQLLANINGIDDPVAVLPGTEIKVVRGPFRAEVSIEKSELTLFLGDLYAGRFPVAIGDDPAPKPGSFTIQDKQAERTYYDPNGVAVPADSPDNPYGNLWLDLGSQLSIHGSPYATRPSPNGCISVAADYANDLYGILSQGSSVTIRR